MLIATWILAGGTTLLALTSLVAVVTWIDNRRREREEQLATRIMDTARKEFSPKDEVGGLMSNLIGVVVLAAAGLVLFLWGKIDNSKRA
jgi:hypothetical protein